MRIGETIVRALNARCGRFSARVVAQIGRARTRYRKRKARLAVLAILLPMLGCGATEKPPPPRFPEPPPQKPIAPQINFHVAAGKKLWDASCPVEQVRGLCLTVGHTDAAVMCAASTLPRLRIKKRDPVMAMRAIAHFGKAIELWRNGVALHDMRGRSQADENRRARVMIGSVAAAYFFLGEPVLESLLARTPAPVAAGPGTESRRSIAQLHGSGARKLREPSDEPAHPRRPHHCPLQLDDLLRGADQASHATAPQGEGAVQTLQVARPRRVRHPVRQPASPATTATHCQHFPVPTNQRWRVYRSTPHDAVWSDRT